MVQTVKKQWTLENLHKITLTLIGCHRSNAKSIDFYFLLL